MMRVESRRYRWLRDVGWLWLVLVVSYGGLIRRMPGVGAVLVLGLMCVLFVLGVRLLLRQTPAEREAVAKKLQSPEADELREYCARISEEAQVQRRR